MIRFKPRDIGCWRYPVYQDGKFLRDELMFAHIDFKCQEALNRFLKLSDRDDTIDVGEHEEHWGEIRRAVFRNKICIGWVYDLVEETA